MTSIAYRNGQMAADTLMVSGHIANGHCVKIVKSKDGTILGGASGDATFGNRFLDWVRNNGKGEPPLPREDEDGSTGSGIAAFSNKLLIVEADGPFEVDCEFWACGSGRDICLTAMHMGKSAAEAVQIATQLDVFSGGRISVLNRS